MLALAFAILGRTLGGAELHAIELARRLVRRGHRVSVLYRSDPIQAALPLGLTDVHRVDTYHAAALLLDRLRPSVLQHFNSLLAVAALELCPRRPRSVEVIHANHELEADYRPVPTDQTDLVVAVSASAARYYPAADHPPVVVIPNGVDLRRWAPSEPPPAPPIRLLSVGRLDLEAKGLGVLLEACAALPRRDWRLTIAGEGGDRARVAARVTALGLDEQVSLPGFSDDLADAYRDCHLFVSASPSEGFGLALVEAAASGRAIVSRRCYGVSEQLTHGLDALLSDHPDELCSHLSRAIDDEHLRRSLGAAARATATALFDIDRMVLEYEAVYRRLIDA